MGGFIDLPWLLVRLTNTVNLSSVSSNATSSGVVSMHVSIDNVVVIAWTLITVILCSLASTLVSSGDKSDLLLLWKRSLIAKVALVLPLLDSRSSRAGHTSLYTQPCSNTAPWL